jgi:hypothetical protein
LKDACAVGRRRPDLADSTIGAHRRRLDRELDRSPPLRTRTSARHQRDPTAANPKQFPIRAGHRLIAKFVNLRCGDAGATHGFNYVVDEAIVVARRLDRDADFGVLGCHRRRPIPLKNVRHLIKNR